MAVPDRISDSLAFAEQLHKHSTKVSEAVELIQPLMDALLAQDHERLAILHGQMSRITSEADRIKFALYDQIKGMHFRSTDSYAFSQYVGSQSKVVDATQDFADVLMLRRTIIPAELRAGLQIFVVHVAKTGAQMAHLAEEFSSPAEGVVLDLQAPDALAVVASIIEGNRQSRQLETEFAQHVYNLESPLEPIGILLLDKYCTALQEITEATERAAEHLRLMIG